MNFVWMYVVKRCGSRKVLGLSKARSVDVISVFTHPPVDWPVRDWWIPLQLPCHARNWTWVLVRLAGLFNEFGSAK